MYDGYEYRKISEWIDLEKENAKLTADYEKCVSKFDDCRAMLARLVKRKGLSVNPPESYEGAWHEYLIKKLQD